jgi:chromosome segregation ATPase
MSEHEKENDRWQARARAAEQRVAELEQEVAEVRFDVDVAFAELREDLQRSQRRASELERERDNYRAMYQSAESEFMEAAARVESAEALLAKARAALEKIAKIPPRHRETGHLDDCPVCVARAVLAEITTASKETGDG